MLYEVITRFDARASNQTQANDGERYVTGVCNAMAIEYDAARSG